MLINWGVGSQEIMKSYGYLESEEAELNPLLRGIQISQGEEELSWIKVTNDRTLKSNYPELSKWRERTGQVCLGKGYIIHNLWVI